MSFLPLSKCRIFASASKVMTAVFWDAERTALTEYLKHGSTFTETCCADLMRIAYVPLKEKDNDS